MVKNALFLVTFFLSKYLTHTHPLFLAVYSNSCLHYTCILHFFPLVLVPMKLNLSPMFGVIGMSPPHFNAMSWSQPLVAITRSAPVDTSHRPQYSAAPRSSWRPLLALNMSLDRLHHREAYSKSTEHLNLSVSFPAGLDLPRVFSVSSCLVHVPEIAAHTHTHTHTRTHTRQLVNTC